MNGTQRLRDAGQSLWLNNITRAGRNTEGSRRVSEFGELMPIDGDSQTETFGALKLNINSWRWKDVPFYIRAGKCLPVTCTEVVARLRKPPALS